MNVGVHSGIYFTTRLYKPFNQNLCRVRNRFRVFPKQVIVKLGHTLELSGVFLNLPVLMLHPQTNYIRLPGSGAQASISFVNLNPNVSSV